MGTIMGLFKVMLIVQLFYAFSITALVYGLSGLGQPLTYANQFGISDQTNTLQGVANQVQSSFDQQSNIPLIDLGALVFFSGNILIDLILNFLFAIPQMFGLILNGFMVLFSFDNQLVALVQLFASAVILVLYMLGAIQLLIGIRSGRLIT